MTSDQQMLQAQQRQSTNGRIFRRRAILHLDANQFSHARTLSVSPDHLSILSQKQMGMGCACTIEFDITLDKKLLRLRIEGSVMHCVLSGTEGFRTGIRVGQNDAMTRKRIEQILTLQAY